MDRIINVLIEQYLFDVRVLSNPWMYYWALIPALLYVSFMLVKWSVLTMPAWISFVVIVTAWSRND